MKSLHSPSSSSSTNHTAIGCIPAILRRMFCSHTLPTFPLDNHIKESYRKDELDELYCGNELKGNPGIVAKLMGLDSMPAENSIEKLRELKKSNCVLEAPSFVELENDKFIILSFEGGGRDKELEVHCSKNRKGLIESNEKVRNSMNQESEAINSCKLSNLGRNSKKLSDKECDKRGISRKKKLEKDETESDSENSSPVSVLEFSDHQESSYSGKEDLKLKNSNSRRKLRGDLDKNAPSTSSSLSQRISSCDPVDDGEESCRNGKQYVVLEKKNFVIGESGDMWEEICKMAERDVMDSRWRGEDFEEIGVCFESQILDQLILELLTIT